MKMRVVALISLLSISVCDCNFVLTQNSTLTDRCAKQYAGIVEVREALAKLEQKRQKLRAILSAQMPAAEAATQKNQVGVNVDRK